jgi:hypothetical protein
LQTAAQAAGDEERLVGVLAGNGGLGRVGRGRGVERRQHLAARRLRHRELLEAVVRRAVARRAGGFGRSRGLGRGGRAFELEIEIQRNRLRADEYFTALFGETEDLHLERPGAGGEILKDKMTGFVGSGNQLAFPERRCDAGSGNGQSGRFDRAAVFGRRQQCRKQNAKKCESHRYEKYGVRRARNVTRGTGPEAA